MGNGHQEGCHAHAHVRVHVGYDVVHIGYDIVGVHIVGTVESRSPTPLVHVRITNGKSMEPMHSIEVFFHQFKSYFKWLGLFKYGCAYMLYNGDIIYLIRYM